MDTVRGLVLASHPGPTATVTVLVVALLLAVGAPVEVAAGAGAAVLLGQLSVGWSNDAVDAVADLRAARATKPVVRGLVTQTQLWLASVVALVLAIAASLVFMGWTAGSLHVVAVLGAWAYNLRLKDTALSPLPYALAFGLLPIIVGALAEPPIAVPAWAALVTAAVGVAAHLANTAPDVASDRRVRRGGLAVVLGSAAARALAVALVGLAGGALLVAGASAGWVGTDGVVRADVAIACAASALGVLVVAAVLRAGRWLFPAVMSLVVLASVSLVVLR